MRAQWLSPLFALAVASAVGSASPSNPGVWLDPAGDAKIRRTDSGNDAQLPMGFEPIDLLSVVVVGWTPYAPESDLYTGSIEWGDAHFVRISIVLDGLVCPAGPIGLNGFGYEPYRYGERPITGFIELDIDGRRDSGGEMMPLARNRYLANVARFGLSPEGSIAEQMAQCGDDIDTDFYSTPRFERTGGEFTLSMCGCFAPVVVSQDGNQDLIFDPGETWRVSGRYFERFQSFQPLGATFGGSDFGLFDPQVELRFSHDEMSDETTITMVYPITNAGAALIAGEAEQAIDLSLLNHTSIEEALDDLIIGAEFATGPLAVLTNEWRFEDVEDFRDPTDWDVTALIGTAPQTQQSSSFYIWTDTGFNEYVADLNLDEQIDMYDDKMLEDFVYTKDGTESDADGIVNGAVGITDFGFGFHFFDLNYDGEVSIADLGAPACIADFTGEGTLDVFDVIEFVSAFNAEDPAADLADPTGVIDIFDVLAFITAFSEGCP